ncbi:MAG: AMP-binding protein, partial [Saprospiraceae bacterium]
YEVIAGSVAKYPERTALRFFLQGNHYQNHVAYTYLELMGKINAAANMFRNLGIGDKSVVTYILPNLPETLFTVYGAETAGIVNAVNPMLDPEHIIDIMNAAGSKILVTLAPSPNTDLWEKALKIIPEVASLETVLTVSLGHYVGQPAQVPTLNGDMPVLDFMETLQTYSSEGLTFQRNIQANDTASYFHTGGTTGRPKIAQHTHDNEIFNAWVLEKQLALGKPQVFFCGLPWFHVNGVIVTGLTPLSGGHTIILGSPSGYRGEGVLANFWKIVDHYKVSFFASVPTILQMLLDVPQQGDDISSLQFALCGAAPLSVQLFNDFEKATNIKILEGYGFTEGTCANSGNPPFGKRRVGSIGFPNVHHSMKVVILDENKDYVRDAEVDEIGTIVARGRNVFPGYKEAIHNHKIFINDGTNQWYNTGDLGREDADGFFWLTGRKKELIIRGGHNIDPKSIEEPLSKHP